MKYKIIINNAGKRIWYFDYSYHFNPELAILVDVSINPFVQLSHGIKVPVLSYHKTNECDQLRRFSANPGQYT